LYEKEAVTKTFTLNGYKKFYNLTCWGTFTLIPLWLRPAQLYSSLLYGENLSCEQIQTVGRIGHTLWGNRFFPQKND